TTCASHTQLACRSCASGKSTRLSVCDNGPIASITNDSVAALHLAKGIQVIALIKAPQITIVTDFGGYKLSARNQLQGIVSQVKTGVINAEIILTIKGGDQIAVTVTKDSVQTLNLHEGQIATAVFKAGAVILAVAS
ncbi:MAG: hypothetical protein RL755_2181, partial [Pseudomonadota bacterium]